MTTITTERIAGSLGAYVHGLDLRDPLPKGDLAALRQAILEHLVVFLPDQDIDLDALERFTDELGGRDITPYVKPVEGRPYVIRVIKEPDDELNFANAWHTDLSYLPEPPAFTVLHAREVPLYGGDTIWANQYLAYETLPAKVREQLLGLNGVHSAGFAYGTGGYLDSVQDKSSMEIEPSEKAYETQVHPLVIRHPETGRAALYANSVYTIGVEGWSPEESAQFLAPLFKHAVNENFTCRLRWEPRMLTIWDNRCTQHFAINDYAGERREMFRTSVKGSAPQPFRKRAKASVRN
jgi:alpha-ketoglutarate-dependent taurine dioxygenase